MIRFTFRIAYNRRVLVLALIVLLTVILGGSVAASDRSASAPAESAAFLSRGGGDIGPWDATSFTCNFVGPVWCVSDESFYVTSENHPTDQVLTVCASGYHMASLWEILDVSNMVYAYNHPDARVRADSGQGPPSGWYGWVRTGWFAATSATAGQGNCNNWNSTSSDDSTVAVRLVTEWEQGPTAYLPLIMKNFP